MAFTQASFAHVDCGLTVYGWLNAARHPRLNLQGHVVCIGVQHISSSPLPVESTFYSADHVPHYQHSLRSFRLGRLDFS